MATIRCKCAAVQIEIAADSDLFRLECCCYDCNAALWYAHKRGGPRCPENLCIDTSWLPNDFRIVKGEDRLGAFRNFANADSTRFYCTDCWSVLFADHTVYAGKILATQVGAYRDFKGLANMGWMPPQARHFLKDLTDEQRAALPPWHGDPSHLYPGVAENLMARLPAMLEAGKEGVNMNARILLTRIGGAFVPTDEPRLSGRPPTLMQQAARQAPGQT